MFGFLEEKEKNIQKKKNIQAERRTEFGANQNGNYFSSKYAINRKVTEAAQGKIWKGFALRKYI